MARRLSIVEIREILRSGNLVELIGVVEDEHFECKSAPYQLQRADERLELAKDVAAFLNSGNGCIVIGLRTDRIDPAQAIDQVVAISAFASGLVNRAQYLDAISGLIFPPHAHIEIEWFASTSNAAIGVVAIFVQQEDATRWPSLVTRTLNELGQLSTRHFALIERVRAGTRATPVEEIQALLRLGRSGSTHEARLQALLDRFEFRFTSSSERSAARDPETLAARVDRAVDAAKLAGERVFALVAVPERRVEVPGLLDRATDSVRLLSKPISLRENGFDLETSNDIALVLGELRRGVVDEYKLLELWRDGMLIFVARADDHFLAWASSRDDRALRVNPLALAECVFLFLKNAIQLATNSRPAPPSITITLRLSAPQDMKLPGLAPVRLNTVAWQFGDLVRPAPETTVERRLEMSLGDDPAAAAYELIRELYAWYGVEADQIPYVVRNAGQSPRVDVNAITKGG